MSRYEKQASSLNVFAKAQNQATEASYRIAHCIAKYGKPFTDGEYIKEAFSVAQILFMKTCQRNDQNKDKTVQRRINEMAENVRTRQTAGLKDATVFSIALDESVDVNDKPRLAVMARY